MLIASLTGKEADMSVLLLMTLLAQAPLAAQLTAIANNIIQEQQLPYEVTVLVPERWRFDYVVNAYTHVNGNQILIGVGPLLAEDLDAEGRRGLIAHELAHIQNPCRSLYLDDPKERQKCEHRADVLSAQWVGSRAVLRGLCQLRASSWYWRCRTGVSHLTERINLMHKVAFGSR